MEDYHLYDTPYERADREAQEEALHEDQLAYGDYQHDIQAEEGE